MNATLLEEIIDASGLTRTAIAEKIGMSRQSLYNKLNGKREFKDSEMKKISKVLNLSKADKDRIFFADFVDANVNTI